MGWSRRLALSAIGTGYLATLARPWRAFRRAAERPWSTQAELLSRFLHRHRDTAYGREHRFGSIDSFTAFQARVPVVDYEVLRPWIERIAEGERNVLSPSPVRAFERSSGTTGGSKLIPLDDAFLAEISHATGPWLFSMYAARPRLIGTTSYWSVSPAARERERTPAGTPIGLEDDTEYFTPVERWALRRTLAVPGTVARIAGVEAWRFATAQHLIASRDLGFISVWNPSFLTLLMETIAARLEEVIPLLPDRARRRELERALAAGEVTGPALWPRLRLISCWTDGHAARFVGAMARWFPGVEIEGKGLLATEGVVSLPVRGGCVAAVRSHFLELEDLDHPERAPLSIERARPGSRYAPIITTGNGFCRYRLPDEVECTGWYARTPLLRFVGKLDRISDLCGEKLTAVEVDRAIDRAAERSGGFTFALVAPAAGAPPRYRLYLEGGSPAAAAREVETALLENHHYRYCRDLGQLGPIEAVAVEGGWRSYERAMVASGMKAGDVKPTHLDPRMIWDDVFVTAHHPAAG